MEKVTYSIEDGIAQIAMDDGKANAMNWGFFEEMGKSMDQTENDGAKALVITGRPGFFSGGLDLKLLPTLSASEMGDFSKIQLYINGVVFLYFNRQSRII